MTLVAAAAVPAVLPAPAVARSGDAATYAGFASTPGLASRTLLGGGSHCGLSALPSWKCPGPGGGVPPDKASFRLEGELVDVVPTIVLLPDGGPQVPAVVVVGVERSATGEPLRARAEYEWSGQSAASLALDVRLPSRELALRGSVRPSTFAALTAGRPTGSGLEGSWLERFGSHTTATLAWSAQRADFDTRDPQAESARLLLRYHGIDGWILQAGVSGMDYRDHWTRTEADDDNELRRDAVSVGAEYNGRRFGVTASFRSEAHSLSRQPGYGGRLALRSGGSAWSARIFADAQQQAATLAVDVGDGLETAAALADVGLVAVSPEEAVNAWRTAGGLLVQPGVTVGGLQVDPLRLRSGLDLSWREPTIFLSELGFRVRMDELHGDGLDRRALLGSLRASWRLSRSADISASYANGWLYNGPSTEETRTTLSIGLRLAL